MKSWKERSSGPLYKRISAFLFPVFAVLLGGALVWGYQANAEKNAVLIQTENNYQRAFHNLTFHMDKLHAELGNALAVNSTSHGYHRKCLVNVWRLASEAIHEIGELPLAVVPIQETEQFLSKLSSFSYQTAVRDMERKPLTPEEMETLAALHQRSREISQSLQKLQHQVLANGLRWLDVEAIYAAKKGNAEKPQNPIVDGFQSLNTTVTEYDEVNWGPSMTSLFAKRSFEMLDGDPVDADEVKQKAIRFFDLPETADIQIEENGIGTDYHTYSLTVQKEPDIQLEIDYTKKGGQLVWFMSQRDVGERGIAAEEAVKKAEQFLKEHDFGTMKPINYDEFHNIAHVSFAKVEDDVVIYPEKVAVKVALDNGEVLGLQATDYIFNHKDWKIGRPQMSADEVQARLNPNFQVEDRQMAVIENDLKQHVLCYQFTGTINGSTYRVYLNADNGMEEKVEEIRLQVSSHQI